MPGWSTNGSSASAFSPRLWHLLTPAHEGVDHLQGNGQSRSRPILPGHAKIDSTVRYLGVDVEDAWNWRNEPKSELTQYRAFTTASVLTTSGRSFISCYRHNCGCVAYRCHRAITGPSGGRSKMPPSLGPLFSTQILSMRSYRSGLPGRLAATPSKCQPSGMSASE
jgi:hypothetical protein